MVHRSLPGVLLHMVEAARPIDAAFDSAGGEFAVDDVRDFVAVVADIEDAGIAETAEVVRLAAGGRIESSLIQERFPGRYGARRCGHRI
jgi:hypothetical protein